MRRPDILFLATLCAVQIGCGTGQPDPAAERRSDDALSSLPYISRPAVREEHKGLRGVVRHLEDRSAAGLNLYGSLTRGTVLARDMTGEVVRRWEAEDLFSARETFPLGEETLELVGGQPSPGIMVAELHGGFLYIIESLAGVAKLDLESNVVFKSENNAHHDLDVAPDGTVYVLTAIPRRIDLGSRSVMIIDDQIEVLDDAGSVQVRLSLFEILSRDERTRPLIEEQLRSAGYWYEHVDEWFDEKLSDDPRARQAQESMFRFYRESFATGDPELSVAHQLYLLLHTPADILHSNSLQILRGMPDSPWRAGMLLLSIRELDLIVVVEPPSGRVVWSWGPGELSRQHQPSLLPNGRILVFDNGTKRKRSRVIELDPASGEIVWSYGDSPESRFFCGAMGGVQGLPNGNVLITDSGAGRAYEVDRDGSIVWDFFNPDRGYNPFAKNPQQETIEAIYRLTRVDAAALDPP